MKLDVRFLAVITFLLFEAGPQKMYLEWVFLYFGLVNIYYTVESSS